jgi:hypothetical protein
MTDAVTSPLPHTAARHALLHQISTRTGTDTGWTRTPNPRKARKPDSGLPDHLYGFRNPDDRPNSQLQRAVRELDRAGLLGPKPTATGPDDLTTSDLGARVLNDWNTQHGTPDHS